MNMSIASLKHRSEQLGILSAILLAGAIPTSTTLTTILLISACVLYYAGGNIKEKLAVMLENNIALLMFAFFAMFIVGVIYTAAPYGEAFKMIMKYSKLAMGMLLFPVFIEEKPRRYAIQLFVLVMVVTLILSYLKYYAGLPINPDFYGPATVFKTHIQMGFLMAIMAYLFLHWTFEKPKHKWFYGLVFVLISFNIFFMSAGRSGYFLYFALMLLFCWQRWCLKGLLITLLPGVLLVASAYYFSPNFQYRINQIGSNINTYFNGDADTSVGLRMEFVVNSFNLVKQHPLVGTGTGSFTSEYAKIEPKPTVYIDNPHNEYLYIAVQFGLIGLVFLLVMLFTQWRESHKLKGDARYLAQAILMAIVVGCLANSWLKDTTEGHLYAYVMALAFASLSVRGDNEQHA